MENLKHLSKLFHSSLTREIVRNIQRHQIFGIFRRYPVLFFQSKTIPLIYFATFRRQHDFLKFQEISEDYLSLLKKGQSWSNPSSIRSRGYLLQGVWKESFAIRKCPKKSSPTAVGYLRNPKANQRRMKQIQNDLTSFGPVPIQIVRSRIERPWNETNRNNKQCKAWMRKF